MFCAHSLSWIYPFWVGLDWRTRAFTAYNCSASAALSMEPQWGWYLWKFFERDFLNWGIRQEFWADLGLQGLNIRKGSVRKVQFERDLEVIRVRLWACEVGLREFCVIRTGGMHGPPRLQGRQVCLSQQEGSIHTGIVLNPAGSCAVQHEPHGDSVFRVAIDSLPYGQGCWDRSDACLPFPFKVHLKRCYSLGHQHFKEDLFGSKSKVHLVRF